MQSISRGLTKLAQVLPAPVRSLPRQALSSRSSISSPRHFGTTLWSHGTPLSRAPILGSLSERKIGTAGILSSHSIFLSNRRFASTDSTTRPSSAEPPSVSELSTNEPGFSSFSDLDSSILNIPENVGYLANLGLDYGWGPTSVCQWVLEHLHYDLGLPWWGAIVGVAVVTRIVMAYPALIAQQTSHKSQELRKDPVYADLEKQFMASLAAGTTQPAELMQQRLQMRHMKADKGIKGWHMALPFLQIPFAYGMFKLTRAMAALPVPGLETAGTLWFTDLTVADPLYVLPCVSALLMYVSMKVRVARCLYQVRINPTH